MKFVLVILLLLSSQSGFGQKKSIYIKFTSDSIKSKRGATLYVTTDYVKMYTVMIPSKDFLPIACDTTKTVRIVADCWVYKEKPYLEVNIPGEFKCGDSVLVNIDKGVTKIINRDH